MTEDLTDWETSDRYLHKPDQRGFCVTCSTRMPCDWSMALDDMKRAATRIEELEAAIAHSYYRQDTDCEGALNDLWVLVETLDD